MCIRDRYEHHSVLNWWEVEEAFEFVSPWYQLNTALLEGKHCWTKRIIHKCVTLSWNLGCSLDKWSRLEILLQIISLWGLPSIVQSWNQKQTKLQWTVSWLATKRNRASLRLVAGDIKWESRFFKNHWSYSTNCDMSVWDCLKHNGTSDSPFNLMLPSIYLPFSFGFPACLVLAWIYDKYSLLYVLNTHKN